MNSGNNDGDNGERPQYPFVIRFFDIDPMEAPLSRQGRLRFPVRTLDGLSSQMVVIPELITKGDDEDREKFWNAVFDARTRRGPHRNRAAIEKAKMTGRAAVVSKKKK